MWRLYGDDGLIGEGNVLPVHASDRIVTVEQLVLASLLSDSRDQEQPDPRGWWGDSFSDNGDRFGSRLWTIPQIVTDQTLRATEEYVLEALSWMVRDSLAKSVSCVASRGETAGSMRLEVGIDAAVVILLDGDS